MRIEPPSEKARELPRQLEELLILRVLPDAKSTAPIQRRWADTLSSEVIQQLRKHPAQTQQGK